jgi:hypothetical protein
MFATLAPLHDLIDKVRYLMVFGLPDVNFVRVRKLSGKSPLTRRSDEIWSKPGNGVTPIVILSMLPTLTRHGTSIIRFFVESRVTYPI